MTVFYKLLGNERCILQEVEEEKAFLKMRRTLFMGKIIVFELLSLDGVMQAPARPDEDQRGGFTHGGWALPYAAMDPDANSRGNSCLLLGRRTYEDFYAVWPKRTGDPT